MFNQEQRSNYEAEMHAKLEREVQDLKAKLAEQEAKTSAAKAKVATEKIKRRAVGGERNEWREKHAANKDARKADKAEAVKEEEAREDRKAMLFEQERKTEQYKLKYIASKEDRKKWEAKAIEQENASTDWKTKFLNQEKKTIALRTELDKNKDIPRILNVNSEKHRMELIDMQARLEDMSKDLEDRAIELSGTPNELRQWKTDGLRLIAQRRDWEHAELRKGGPDVSALVVTLEKKTKSLESKLYAQRTTNVDNKVLELRKCNVAMDAKMVAKNEEL
jgi:hypothetical protein